MLTKIQMLTEIDDNDDNNHDTDTDTDTDNDNDNDYYNDCDNNRFK